MALSEDLIDFELIETHKENIQSLPGGRSAKQLASILSPLPSSRTGSEPTFGETKTLNDAIRQEYENELLSIADSDDPLDIYDRYVKWTLNAYPSAQATPQSQLLPLLERATKTFLTSSHYKNDPRYLKLWLHYVRLFSDTPRETFAFLARHHIGETLGLFYEEFAAWLENAGRWTQADEVYRMGVEREARPAERLMRKYTQFRGRFDARPEDSNEPSSPALPTVRPALAAKIDPFAAAPRTEDSQTPRNGAGGAGGAGAKSKSGKQKMAIFNDAESEAPPPSGNVAKGWDSIGSIRERKKENTIEARPWAGETLKAGKRAGAVPKMEIFKDSNSQIHESKKPSPSISTDVVNPRTGRTERAFVKLEAVYPNDTEEYSFEELRAFKRGWMNRDWKAERMNLLQESRENTKAHHQPYKSIESVDVENLTSSFQDKAIVSETSSQSMLDTCEQKPPKQKKIKHREVKQETQTVKTRLDSPTGRKVKRKASATTEPTMTFHSKAAMNDIYNIFNHSKKEPSQDNSQSADDNDNGDDTYSTAGESVGAEPISGNNSEFGDDTTKSFGFDNTSSQPESGSPWSDFTLSKHMPEGKMSSKSKHKKHLSDDMTGDFGNHTMGAFDTQAIAALAGQDFGELDTKMIAQLAGDDGDDEDQEKEQEQEQEANEDAKVQIQTDDNLKNDVEVHSTTQDLRTPVESCFIDNESFEVVDKPRYIPLPPEDYEPTPLRPYRDPVAAAHNKLPFMTPIVERTESSMAPSTIFQQPDYFTSKSPIQPILEGSEYGSPSKLQIDDLLLSSPAHGSPSSTKRRKSVGGQEKDSNYESPPKKPMTDSPTRKHEAIPFPIARSPATQDVIESVTDDVFEVPAAPPKVVEKARPIHKGPIILDLQCNPCDPAIRQQILDNVYPSLSTYQGFVDSSDQSFNHHNILKVYAAKQKKDAVKYSPRKSQNEKTLTKAVPPILKFNKTDRVYAVKKELGKGAYAPVYLVDSYNAADVENSPFPEDENSATITSSNSRGELEAVKTESPPLTLVWEFHILHLVRSRLGDASRSMTSIIKAQECHLYRDESYLILSYHSQGTLLDLLNLSRSDSHRAGKPSEGVDELTAMWLTVELLRTMDDIWRVGLLHGDLKIDNCLVRLDDADVTAPYSRDGDHGWSGKGLTLIDFGRGIDTRAYVPNAKFVADWTPEDTDCAEIREARPWKFEIDLFGAAGVIHSLLFGKYIDTVAVGGGGLGQKKEWKLRESLKRYWEREIWCEVFAVLINGGKLADLAEVRSEVGRVRGLMEDWLEAEGERGGRDLRGAVRRCERLVRSR